MKNLLIVTALAAVLSTPAYAQIVTGSPGADVNSPQTQTNVNTPTNVNAPITTVAPINTNVVAPIVAPVIAPTISPDIRTTTTVSPTIRTDVNTTDFNTVTTRVDPTLINGQQQDAHNQQGQNQQTSSAATGGSSNQTQSTSSSATTGASTATNAGNAQNLTVNEAKQLRAPVNTAYAAPLSIGGGVCAYSAASLGGSGIGFSASGSVAKMDEGCTDRADADLLARLGFQRQAAELLKTHPRVAAAFAVVESADKTKVYGQAPSDPIGEKLASNTASEVYTQGLDTVIPRKDGGPVKGTMLPIPN